jgi:hypothetical protein
MALEMNQLAGFMRLGPQTFPARPNAVQVIERGPHGKRMAADPVATRLRKPRGSGFRFWVEQLNVPADESWNPPQRVVGLMGLGEGQSAFGRMATVLQRESIRADVVCALDNENGPLFQKIANDVFPTKASVHAGVSEMRELVDSMRTGDTAYGWRVQAMICLARWNAGKDDRAELNRLHRVVILKKAEMREDGKPMISPTAMDAHGNIRQDSPTAAFVRAIPGALEDRGQEVFGGKGDGLCSREQLRVPVFGAMMCRGRGEPRPLFKNPIVTAAVFAGGALILYGVARGIGGAIAGGR